MGVIVLPILPCELLRLREGKPAPQGGTAHVFTVGKVMCHATSHGGEMEEQGWRQVQSGFLDPWDCPVMKLLGAGTASQAWWWIGGGLYAPLACLVWTDRGCSKVPEILEPISHDGSGEVGGGGGRNFKEYTLKNEYNIGTGFLFFLFFFLFFLFFPFFFLVNLERNSKKAPIFVSLPGVVLFPYKSFVTEAPYF